MPIAGALADRYPLGRIVPVGLLVIVGSMFALTRIQADSTNWGFLIPILFVMGLGMGFTMMPLNTAALRSLAHHEVARGSTLVNINQQIASSIGVAIFSVVLTNQFNDKPLIAQGSEYLQVASKTQDPAVLQGLLAKFPLVGRFLSEQSGGPADAARALAAEIAQLSADSFAFTFLVAAILVTTALIPAYLLPRRVRKD